MREAPRRQGLEWRVGGCARRAGDGACRSAPGLWLAALLALLLPAVLLPAAPARSQSRPGGPYREVLPNGLTLIVQEQRTSPLVAVQAWVRAGSRDEDDETNGAAHFVEHMLFKGTARRKVGEIDREVAEVGGQINASTFFDYTQYWLVAAGRFFERLVDLQADALRHSSFDAAEVERERQVIIEELNRREDSPFVRTFDRLYTTAFTVHPYRRPIGGSREVIRRMSREALLAFYRRYYVPSNVTIVVAGDVATADAVRVLRRAYASWRGPRAERPAVPPEPPWTGVRRAVVEQDVRAAYLHLGWLAPAARDPDLAATDVLVYALGQGRGARLLQALRDRRRVAQSVSAFFPTAQDPTLVSLYVVTEPELAAEAERALLEEVAAVRDGDVSEEEVARARALLEGETLRSRHTSRGLATTLGFYATVAELEVGLGYVERVRAVTRADVQRVARRFLDPGRYAAVLVRPRPSAP